MFYCPYCKCKVYLDISIENIPADYSANILVNSINLALCSIGSFMNINIKGYKCSNCDKVIEEKDLYTRSQFSGKFDIINNFLIVSIKNKKDEIIDGKVVLVIPPKIIHEEELDKFNELSNPYKDKKYLLIHRLTNISFTSPK